MRITYICGNMLTDASWAGLYLNPASWFGVWKRFLPSRIDNLSLYLPQNSCHMLSCSFCSRPVQLSTSRVIKSCLAIVGCHWLIRVWSDVLQGANWAFWDLSGELEVVIIFPFLPNMISGLQRSLIDSQMNRMQSQLSPHCAAHDALSNHMIITILFYIYLSLTCQSYKNTRSLSIKKGLYCGNQSINESEIVCKILKTRLMPPSGML